MANVFKSEIFSKGISLNIFIGFFFFLPFSTSFVKPQKIILATVQGQGINNAFNHHHSHQIQQHSTSGNTFTSNSFNPNNTTRCTQNSTSGSNTSFDPNMNSSSRNMASSVNTPTYGNIILVPSEASNEITIENSLLELDDTETRYLNSFVRTNNPQGGVVQASHPPPSYENLTTLSTIHNTGEYHATSNDFVIQDDTGNQIIFHRSNMNGGRLYQSQSLVLDETTDDNNSAELDSEVQAMIDNYGLVQGYENEMLNGSSPIDTKDGIIMNQLDLIEDERNLLIEQNSNVGYYHQQAPASLQQHQTQILQQQQQQQQQRNSNQVNSVIDRGQERLLLENTMSPLCKYFSFTYTNFLSLKKLV